MSDSVLGSAWNEYHRVEKEKAAKAKRAQARANTKAKVERAKLEEKFRYLLTESPLIRWFPKAMWSIRSIDPDNKEIVVSEKDDDYSPEFIINSEGVFMKVSGEDYQGRWSNYRRRVTSVYDVGQVLKHNSDFMDEQYRRHPD